MWAVQLAGSFKPYEADVSAAIEQSFRRGDDEVDVTIRGQMYIIAFSTMRQKLRSDPSRQRRLQRTAPPLAAAPPARADPLPSAPPPSAPPPPPSAASKRKREPEDDQATDEDEPQAPTLMTACSTSCSHSAPAPAPAMPPPPPAPVAPSSGGGSLWDVFDEDPSVIAPVAPVAESHHSEPRKKRSMAELMAEEDARIAQLLQDGASAEDVAMGASAPATSASACSTSTAAAAASTPAIFPAAISGAAAAPPDDDATDEDNEDDDDGLGDGTPAPGAPDPLGPLADCEKRQVQGSGANTYDIKRVGDTYSCTCPAWRNQAGAGPMRTCKHIKGLRGEQAEQERLGDSKSFYASGNRVAGAPSASGSSTNPKNETVVKGVALADKWDEKSDLTGWALSEKLDGMRCIWDGDGALWSRQGNEISAPPSLLASLPRGTPLDGELFMGRGSFQSLMSIVKRIDRLEAPWEPVEYVIFDAPSAPGGIFDRLKAAQLAIDQCGGAATPKLKPKPWLRILEHSRATDTTQVKARLDAVVAGGGEGVVVRHPTAAHRGGRNSGVLKLKKFLDDEALVTGHEAGKGKHVGRMGALVCRMNLSAGSKTFKVGTGFSDAQRQAPPAIGSVVTFKYGELTQDGMPRFPSFLRVRPDVSATLF